MTTEDDLAASVATALAHLRPGGAAISASDCVREPMMEQTELQEGGEQSAYYDQLFVCRRLL